MHFLLSGLSLVLIDLLLAGDNALVIALAVRSLPKQERRIGLIGTAFTESDALESVCRMTAEAGGRVSFSSVRMTPGKISSLASRAGDHVGVHIVLAQGMPLPVFGHHDAA